MLDVYIHGREIYGSDEASDSFIYSPASVREACSEIEHGYRRSPGYIHDMIGRELVDKGYHEGRPVDQLAGDVCELCLLDRLNWLEEERGWSVRYPVDEPFFNGKYALYPERPGRRVRMADKATKITVAEFDGVALIEGNWTLFEAKTRSPFSVGNALNQINLFQQSGIIGYDTRGPAYIIAVTNNHRLRHRYSGGRFVAMGGNMLFLKGLDSDHIPMLVGDCFEETGKMNAHQAA